MSSKGSNDGDGIPRHQRRSKPIKNLEEEVDLILSQDDSDDSIHIAVPIEEAVAMTPPQQKQRVSTPLKPKTRSNAKRRTRTTKTVDLEEANIVDASIINQAEEVPKTPNNENKDKVIVIGTPFLPSTPKSSGIFMTETPRRSARKSIRPPLDYDDIIEKKMLRSVTKNTANTEYSDDNVEPQQQKWTKALVGGVSQSRGRKSKRAAGKKRAIAEEERPDSEVISKKRTKSVIEANVDDPDNEPKAETPKEGNSTRKTRKQRNTKSTISIVEDLSNKMEEENTADPQSQMEENSIKDSVKKSNKKKRNTKSTTNKDKDLLKEMENGESSQMQVESQDNQVPIIEVIPKEVQFVENGGQLMSAEVIEKYSEELLLQDQKVDSTEMLIGEHKAHDAGNEIIDLDSLEEEKSDKDVESPSAADEDNELVEKSDDNFGSYLKSNIIDLTDLGLEPIITKAPLAKEMTVLLVSDDKSDDIANNGDEEGEKCVTKNELNLTFDAEEKAMDVECKQLKADSPTEGDMWIMQSLQISDDEEEAVREVIHLRQPRQVSFKEEVKPTTTIKVVLTDPDEHNSTLLKSHEVNLPTTPKSLSTTKINRVATPYRQKQLTPYKQKEATPYKQKAPTPYKQKEATAYKQKAPTPYKQREATPNKQKETTLYKQNKENVEFKNPIKSVSLMTPISMSVNIVKNNLTTLEPKDIVLRSIRKRSKSVSINPEPNTAKGVTFYSPANQTLHIEDLDKLMANNVKKDQVNDSYVTKRRKRSISLDDARIKVQTSKIPKLEVPPVASKFKTNTPNKIRAEPGRIAASKPPMRTKMPNFAAIHQKNFNQMENLVEHIERKAERAKILANSATKIRSASAQKVQKWTTSKHLDGGVVPLKDKPKALKKINMTSVFENIGKKPESNPFGIANKEDDLKQQKKEELLQEQPIILSNLPKPRPMSNQTTMTKSLKKPTTTISNSQILLKEPNARLGGIALSMTTNSTSSTTGATLTKAPFNLSTNTTNNKTAYQTKMEERRQRHMGMYKGRTGAPAGSHRAGRENEASNVEIIRGVRSNRRFELQMQHRKNIDQ